MMSDVPVTTDASQTDAVRNPDVPISMPPSGVTAAACGTVLDLEALGTRVGDTITVHGTTNTPLEVVRGPCNPALTGHQVFRYRVRGENVSLHMTTNLPGGTDLLDTTIFVLTGSCSETATVLACNDDDFNTPENRSGTSTLATASLARDTDVTVIVAAYANVRRGAVSRGEFNLGITEVPSAALAADCDATVAGGCVPGLECAAISLPRGICVTPTNETEPNGTPAMAGAPRPIVNTFAIHAAIEPAGDVDCYALDIPAGADLYLEANDGAGSCPADLRADIYRAGEMDPFDGDDDTGRATDVACPLVSAVENAGARAMPAGIYTVCIRASEPAGVPMVTVGRYSLQVASTNMRAN